MERLKRIICIGVVFAILCSGCGDNEAKRTVKNNNTVDAVIQNEIDKSNQENTPEAEIAEKDAENQSLGLNNDSLKADSNVDVDISVMNSDMTYAAVYQLMMEPDKYIGKKIKITGNYYSTYYEPTGLVYHYALIKDAAACCAQGLEFELAEGLEYPKEDELVTVTGTFEVYKENGYFYCVLKDAYFS